MTDSNFNTFQYQTNDVTSVPLRNYSLTHSFRVNYGTYLHWWGRIWIDVGIIRRLISANNTNCRRRRQRRRSVSGTLSHRHAGVVSVEQWNQRAVDHINQSNCYCDDGLVYLGAAMQPDRCAASQSASSRSDGFITSISRWSNFKSAASFISRSLASHARVLQSTHALSTINPILFQRICP